MSLLTTAEHRRQRLLRRLLLATTALLVVVVTSVVVTLLAVDRTTAPTTEGAGTSPPTDPAVGERRDAAGDTQAGIWRTPPVSAGPLILPQPTGSQRGIPVGFPHSTEGAISAGAHYARTGLGLDPDRARILGEVAGAPSYVDAPNDFAQAASSAREALGLGAADPTRGAYLTFEPQAYRVMDATPDRVTLALLGRVDAAGPATQGQGRSSYVGTSYTLVWADNDWRIAGDGPELPANPPTPRSPVAYEEGWRDLAIA